MSTANSNDQETRASGQAAKLSWKTEQEGNKLAKRLINNARYREALDVLEGVQKKLPNSLRPRQLEGLAYARWGHLHDARGPPQ